jgi:uncharacterized membrane protein (UPF0182 family)
VGDHAVFVQPVYEWGPAGAPTLAYVAVLFDDSVHVAPTLGQLAGRPATPGGTARPRAPDTGSIRELYQSMRDALRRGDWVAFGRAFDALGALLARGRP